MGHFKPCQDLKERGQGRTRPQSGRSFNYLTTCQNGKLNENYFYYYYKTLINNIVSFVRWRSAALTPIILVRPGTVRRGLGAFHNYL